MYLFSFQNSDRQRLYLPIFFVILLLLPLILCFGCFLNTAISLYLSYSLLATMNLTWTAHLCLGSFLFIMMQLLVCQIFMNKPDYLFPLDPSQVPTSKRILRLLPVFIGGVGAVVCWIIVYILDGKSQKSWTWLCILLGGQAGVIVISISWIFGYGDDGFLKFACPYAPIKEEIATSYGMAAPFDSTYKAPESTFRVASKI